MTRDGALETIRPLAPELKRLGLGKLYLFGSVAREEPQPNDVDLFYEADEKQKLDYFELADAAERLEKLLGKRVDLVDRKLLHRRIRPRVEAELVEIY